MAENEVLVSIQALGARDDPRAGHLAAGVLGDSSTVLVPNPPPTLLDPEQAFEVLTIPVPLDVRRPIERLVAWCRKEMLAGPDDRPVAVVLKLTRPSRYPPAVNEYSGRTLAAELDANGGDLWAAMEAVGMVPGGLADGPPADILDAVAAMEREQRRGIVRAHRHAMPGDVGISLCKILCVCIPS